MTSETLLNLIDQVVKSRAEYQFIELTRLDKVTGNMSSDLSGFIFINKSNRDEDTLKHEWGHTMQFLILGMGDYLNMIFLPSSISNLIDRNFSLPYYQLPWEVTADMMGGVVRDGTTLSHQILGLAYLAKAELISNAVVKPAILPAYSTAAGVVDLLVPGLGTLLFTWIYTS